MLPTIVPNRQFEKEHERCFWIDGLRLHAGKIVTSRRHNSTAGLALGSRLGCRGRLPQSDRGQAMISFRAVRSPR